jgi:hypothetical protein
MSVDVTITEKINKIFVLSLSNNFLCCRQCCRCTS